MENTLKSEYHTLAEICATTLIVLTYLLLVLLMKYTDWTLASVDFRVHSSLTAKRLIVSTTRISWNWQRLVESMAAFSFGTCFLKIKFMTWFYHLAPRIKKSLQLNSNQLKRCKWPSVHKKAKWCCMIWGILFLFTLFHITIVCLYNKSSSILNQRRLLLVIGKLSRFTTKMMVHSSQISNQELK